MSDVRHTGRDEELITTTLTKQMSDDYISDTSVLNTIQPQLLKAGTVFTDSMTNVPLHLYSGSKVPVPHDIKLWSS